MLPGAATAPPGAYAPVPTVPRLAPHQIRALEKHRSLRYSANLSPTGCGKTLPAAYRLLDLVPPRRALIVAPQQGIGTVEKPGAWPRLLSRLNPRWQIKLLVGTRAVRHARLREPHHIGIINYEGLQVLGDDLVRVGGYGVFLPDEVHRCKNAASMTSRACGAIAAQMDYVVGLTGSPILENPIDLYGIYRAIYPAMFGPDFYAWRGRYFDWRSDVDEDGHREYPRWHPRPGAMEVLASAVGAVSFYAGHEVWADFPKMNEVDPVYAELPPPVRALYNQFRQETEVGLSTGTITLDNIRPRLLKMCQLTAGWVYDAAHRALPIGRCTKAEALSELIDEIKGEPTTIWAVHPPDMTLIQTHLQRFGRRVRYGTIYGETPQAERQDTINAFNAGKLNVLVAHPLCVGELIDLEEQHDIRFSRTWSSTQFVQSRGRGRRASSRHSSVNYYEILARDTIDEGIYYALRAKGSYLSTLLKYANFDRAEEAARAAAEAAAEAEAATA